MFNIFKNNINYRGSAGKHVFIVGTGRCGTTILASVLNAHSRLCVPPELQIIFNYSDNGDRFYEKFISGEMSRYRAKDFIKRINRHCPYDLKQFFDFEKFFKNLNYPQTDLKQLLHDLFDYICYTHGKDVFVEQTPWYGQRLDLIREFFPEMKVVHLVRDGRDVALSFARTDWWSRDVGQNIIRWAEEVENIKAYGKQNPESFVEIRYEDLACNPEAELQKILDMLNLSLEPDMLKASRLINYWSMYKGETGDKFSTQYQQWEKNMEKVFFADNIYAWKKNQNYDFKKLSEPARATFAALNYEL